MPLIRFLPFLITFFLCSGFYYPQQDLSDHLFAGIWEGSHDVESSAEGYNWTLKQNPDHSLVIHFSYKEKNISIIEYGTWKVVDGIIFHHIEKVQINEKPIENKNLIFDYKVLSISPQKLKYQSLNNEEAVVYESVRRP